MSISYIIFQVYNTGNQTFRYYPVSIPGPGQNRATFEASPIVIDMRSLGAKIRTQVQFR